MYIIIKEKTLDYGHIIPPYCSRLYPNYKGMRILEFGNKKTGKQLYRDEYLLNGASTYHSVDINGEDGAIPIDLRRDDAADEIKTKTGYNSFDFITNIGTSEHVTIQKSFYKCVHELMHEGTYVVHWTPQAKKRIEHSRAGSVWHAYPEFFEHLAAMNGYAIELKECTPKRKNLPYGKVGWDLTVVRYKATQNLTKEFYWDPVWDEKFFWRNPNYDEAKWNAKLNLKEL